FATPVISRLVVSPRSTTSNAHLTPFPTRRSSDLDARAREAARGRVLGILRVPGLPERLADDGGARPLRRLDAQVIREREECRELDRKSTRLNSSHGSISYAVFCLKKKTQQATAER